MVCFHYDYVQANAQHSLIDYSRPLAVNHWWQDMLIDEKIIHIGHTQELLQIQMVILK